MQHQAKNLDDQLLQIDLQLPDINSSLLLCNKLKLQFKGTKKPLPFNHELITPTHITLQILTF